MIRFANPEEETLEKSSTQTDDAQDSKLILYNDEFNTFDHVIESIKVICELDQHQAEQIAMLAHYRGKATVRKGERAYLESMSAKLADQEITTEVV